MWEPLRNKQHVRDCVEKRGTEISGTHPIHIHSPAEKKQWTLKLLWSATSNSQGSQELCSVCVRVRVNEQAGRNSLSGLAGWDEDQAQDGNWSTFHLSFSNWGLRLGGKLAFESQPLAYQNPRALVHSQNTQPRWGLYTSHVIENRNWERWVHCYLLAWGLSQTILTIWLSSSAKVRITFPEQKYL